MQGTFWNGTHWPSAIQWTGAFIDTLLAASDISLLASPDNANDDVLKYKRQIETYFNSEDVIQIFGAAYDDVQWVVLEWLEVIKFLRRYDPEADLSRYAHRAHIFYHVVQDKFNTSLCNGGLTWNPALATYKNAITNELFMASSISMYLYFPGDQNSDPYPATNYQNITNATLPVLSSLAAHDSSLLENAQKGYEWFKAQNFVNTQGLIIDGFHISDNQTTCNKPNEMVYTYNQGVILSALRGLWEATGDESYLADGHALVQTVIRATGWSGVQGQWAGLGRNGIMEDYCDAALNCSQDAQTFKGIYFHHLGQFCEPLPTTTALVPGLTKLASSSLAASHAGNCSSMTSWIQHNTQAALSTRNKTGIIGGWWGADDGNTFLSQSLQGAAQLPRNSDDYRNNPQILHEPPWICQNCRTIHRRDANDGGRGRTVESHASGLGVVKAASDFLA
ncbi:glycoside hydrolase family 76 protein [Piedraia hortae CBS 480.64]|uniref:Glycoside hydrolase family 76 protein n=1 Tax=Piedraia hortae CBS 480.64 TaxID=1314780 RepID=A0A6A7C6B1_9PEZI|nr:glycoside hydrolase family 76 protein [Piedraia hortae CBS 480.64]